MLVDEAQDTNAAQWDIIEQLVEEYFSGSSESRASAHRTLFMVGDFKQAIYGFQGTDPKRFGEAREEFKRRAEELSDWRRYARAIRRGAREFRDLSIAASFRSAQPVLDVVDAVIETLGPTALGAWRAAAARTARIHRDRAGQVELWQPFAVENRPEKATKARSAGSRSAHAQYADALAERIARWSTKRRCLPSTSGR